VQHAVGQPRQHILEGRSRDGEHFRDVTAVQDVFQRWEDRGKDVGSPLGGDESAAVEEDQPRGHCQEWQHEQAGAPRDQKCYCRQRNWQLEPNGLVHDEVAEREEDEQKDILEIVEGILVLL